MPDADFGTEGQETEEGHKLDPSEDKEKQGLPDNIQKLLAQDIEQTLGGLFALKKGAGDNQIAHLCEEFPDLYGKSTSRRRRAVQNKVARWKNKLPDNYLKDLKRLGVQPSVHTVVHVREELAKRPPDKKAAVAEKALSEEFAELDLSSPPRNDTRVAFSPIQNNPTWAAKETHRLVSPLQRTLAPAVKQSNSPFPHQSIMSHLPGPGYPADFDPSRCSKFVVACYRYCCPQNLTSHRCHTNHIRSIGDEPVNLDNPELNTSFKAYMLRDCTITGSNPPNICDGVFIKKTDGEMQDVLANKIKLFVIPTEDNVLLLEEPAYPASETTQAAFDAWKEACRARNNVTVEEAAFNVLGATLTNVGANAARQKKWTKLVFEGRIRFDNEVFSRGLGNFVRPVPVPIELRPVTFGQGQNRVTMQLSTCPVVWTIACKGTVRPTEAGNEPENIMEAILNGQFAG